MGRRIVGGLSLWYMYVFGEVKPLYAQTVAIYEMEEACKPCALGKALLLTTSGTRPQVVSNWAMDLWVNLPIPSARDLIENRMASKKPWLMNSNVSFETDQMR